LGLPECFKVAAREDLLYNPEVMRNDDFEVLYSDSASAGRLLAKRGLPSFTDAFTATPEYDGFPIQGMKQELVQIQASRSALQRAQPHGYCVDLFFALEHAEHHGEAVIDIEESFYMPDLYYYPYEVSDAMIAAKAIRFEYNTVDHHDSSDGYFRRKKAVVALCLPGNCLVPRYRPLKDYSIVCVVARGIGIASRPLRVFGLLQYRSGWFRIEPAYVEICFYPRTRLPC
jgi:hypothetical protein